MLGIFHARRKKAGVSIQLTKAFRHTDVSASQLDKKSNQIVVRIAGSNEKRLDEGLSCAINIATTNPVTNEMRWNQSA